MALLSKCLYVTGFLAARKILSPQLKYLPAACAPCIISSPLAVGSVRHKATTGHPLASDADDNGSHSLQPKVQSRLEA